MIGIIAIIAIVLILAWGMATLRKRKKRKSEDTHALKGGNIVRETRYCPYCGYRMYESSNYCKNCGRDVPQY